MTFWRGRNKNSNIYEHESIVYISTHEMIEESGYIYLSQFIYFFIIIVNLLHSKIEILNLRVSQTTKSKKSKIYL